MLALPFRVPIQAGGTTSNLLVPLYLVVAASARWRGSCRRCARPPRAGDRGRSHRDASGGWAVWVDRALALYVVLYAVQAIYSPDFEKALQQMVFFYVPFTLLYVLLRAAGLDAALLRRCLILVAAMAVVFSVIGFVEYATKTIILNSKLVVANDLHTYFTVNSVFFDPDIFGRFLALVMILLAVLLLYQRPRREQLLVSRRAGRAVGGPGADPVALEPGRAAGRHGGAGGAALEAVPGAGGGGRGDRPGRGGGGDHPDHVRAQPGASTAPPAAAAAWSAAGLTCSASARSRATARVRSSTSTARHHQHNVSNLAASHTIPITIAAEQGLIGELAYVALVIAAVVCLVRRARGDPARAAVAAAFIALVFHTMLYADFLEDPFTWALLGIGVALAVMPGREAAVGRRRGQSGAGGAGADDSVRPPGADDSCGPPRYWRATRHGCDSGLQSASSMQKVTNPRGQTGFVAFLGLSLRLVTNRPGLRGFATYTRPTRPVRPGASAGSTFPPDLTGFCCQPTQALRNCDGA